MFNTKNVSRPNSRLAVRRFLLGLAVIWAICGYYLTWSGQGLKIATSFPVVIFMLGINLLYVGGSICGYILSTHWRTTNFGKVSFVGAGVPLILFGIGGIIFYLMPSSDLAFSAFLFLSVMAFLAMQIVWVFALREWRKSIKS